MSRGTNSNVVLKGNIPYEGKISLGKVIKENIPMGKSLIFMGKVIMGNTHKRKIINGSI